MDEHTIIMKYVYKVIFLKRIDATYESGASSSKLIIVMFLEVVYELWVY